MTPAFAGIRFRSTSTENPSGAEEVIIFHQLVLAAYSQPEAAGFILHSIKLIFLLIGGIISSIICAVIAAMKGRNPFGWGILGFFFSILTLIVVIVIPSKKD
ncbi:MAG: deoxyribodipyrimidine photolyase [Mycobacterium sp.]|uniref:deoxyribodipyrimidine photolyase n=1 Tax=Mycobacterium sp. TaxID=1785 RepID=UPI003BB18093